MLTPLPVLTNWVLLINWLLFLKFQKIKIIFLNLNFIIFLTNEKITNIITNNFSTLNIILFIEVKTSTTSSFQIHLQIFLTSFLDLHLFQGIPLS